MKPDVTAPGVDLLSSLPHNQWSNHDWSGTSMAAPHVAAAAALLKERHPAWTPAQVKSALESTGAPVHPGGSATELTPLREGGGRIDLPHADNPLVFTDPTGLSFGLVTRGTTSARQLALADAGGGASPWTASIDAQTALHYGMVNRVVPRADLAEATMKFAKRLALIAPEALAATKLAINRGADAAGFRTAIRAGLDVLAPLYAARTEVGVKFDEIRERDGLVAALRWRAAQFAE